jgi:zinc transporter ZupT
MVSPSSSSSSSASNSAARALLRFLAEDDHDAGATAAAESAEETSSTSQPWGDVILASLIIQTVTLTGLFVSATMSCCKKVKNGQTTASTSPFWSMVSTLVIPSFAGGALLATAIFLIIPEALHLVPLLSPSTSSDEEHHEEGEEDDHSGHDRYRRYYRRFLQEGEEGDAEHAEPDQPWKVGAAILGGFLFPMLFWIVFPGHHHHAVGGRGCEEAETTPCAGSAKQMDEDNIQQEQQDDINPKSALEKSINNISEDGDEYNDDGTKVTTTETPPPILAPAAPRIADGATLKESIQDDAEAAAVQERTMTNAAPPIASGAVAASMLSKSISTSTTTPTTRKPINWTLAASILVGDFFHNFTDGVFLGSAFSLCSRELGYTLVASTVYHELAQEIADFFLLTNTCHLYQWEALALNFVAGFSVMIGALMVLAIDMTDTSKGIVLALSAGVYLHISASECVPRAQGQCKTSKDALVFLLCFILGAVPIGLVLLNHEHCEADAHEGH